MADSLDGGSHSDRVAFNLHVNTMTQRKKIFRSINEVKEAYTPKRLAREKEAMQYKQCSKTRLCVFEDKHDGQCIIDHGAKRIADQMMKKILENRNR